MANLGDFTPDRRSFFEAARSDLSRLGHISAVLIRHGFASFVQRAGLRAPEDMPTDGRPHEGGSSPEETARRFREVLEELGPTFVKVGQILSSRPDLLPPVFITELQRLQDNAPPIPFSVVKAAVEQALHGEMDTYFSHFEEVPLASASMAQAHIAHLAEGGEVVVKVQRPGIEETIRADLDLLRLVALVLESTIAEMELVAAADLVAALDDALTAELDFRREAKQLQRFRNNYASVSDVFIPAVHEHASCQTLLTLDRVRGRKITSLTPGSDEAKRFALRWLELAYTMIFDHGFFHGDPHPGNVFATDDDRLGLIDFGMCGALSRQQRDYLITLILSVIAGDADGIARVLLRMGTPVGHVPLARFKTDITSIRERYLRRDLTEIDIGGFLRECMDAAGRYRIRIPGDYLVLSKAIVTMEGILRHLDPHLDLVSALQPYGQRLLLERFRTDRLVEGGIATLLGAAQIAREIPEQLSQVLMDLETGHLRVQVESQALRQVRHELHRQGTRLSAALVAGALLVTGALILPHDPLRLEVWGWSLPVLTLLCLSSAGALVLFVALTHLTGGARFRLRLSPLLRILRRGRA